MIGNYQSQLLDTNKDLSLISVKKLVRWHPGAGNDPRCNKLRRCPNIMIG